MEERICIELACFSIDLDHSGGYLLSFPFSAPKIIVMNKRKDSLNHVQFKSIKINYLNDVIIEVLYHEVDIVAQS